MSTITSAPTYTLHRDEVTAVDGAVTLEAAGFNASGYEKVHVQVVPSAAANPSVEVLVWSSEAGKFIHCHTALTFAGKGANTPYEFTVDALGRQMFVAVTTLAAGSTNVYVAGWHA